MNLGFFYIWFAFLFFSSQLLAAGNPAWNCEQSKNGEWVCLNEGVAPAEPVKPQPAESQPVNTQPAKPKPAETVENIQSDSPALPKIEPDKPVSIEAIVQPAVPVPEQPVKPVVTLPKPAIEPVAKAPVTEPVVVEPAKPRVKVTENPKPSVEKVEPVREQASNDGRPPGWTCQSGGDQQNWNCNLVGNDPQGEAQPVADEQVESHWLTPAFSHSQERTFQTLRSEFKQDPWQGCEKWTGKKRKTKPVSSQIRENAITDVTADFSEAFEGEVMNFAGNVDLTRADQHLLADKASYDTGAGTMDAQGNVIYSETSMALASQTSSMNLNTDEARLRKALFISGDGPLRGSAETIYRDSKVLSRYNETAFTSCNPGNQDWVIHASRLKINKEVGQGSAKDAWLEFKHVPVMYTPYISFPTDNRRLSGFLSPTWGSTTRSGFYVTAPYYWNIAPNVDSTISARYFSSRGPMLSNSLRYLTETSKGSLGTEYMPNDKIQNKPRYFFSLKDTSSFAPNLSSQVALNLVSDKTYFNDLNNALGVQRSTVLPSTASLNYNWSGISFNTSLLHYQSVDPTVTSAGLPYDVLPRVTLNFLHNFDSLPLRLGIDTQYSDFAHKTLVNGQRLMLWPYLSMPFESTAGFLIPKFSVQSTQYQLSNMQVPGQSASINRTLPVFSLDGGLVLEKPMDFDDTPYNNIIEPRFFYLYIPRKDQSAIPIFDTSAFDINFNSLFRENSYSGFDRLQDANQITLATTSRYINTKTGLEPLKASFGEIIYFQNRTVTLTSTNQPTYPTVPVQTSKSSNFITDISGQITQHLSYATGAQWNTESNRFARGQAVLKYRSQPDAIFDIGYRYRNAAANPLVPISIVPGSSNIPANISITDVSFRLPVFDEWYALGRWQYSLNFDKTLESFIGLERSTCCWRFRILGRRFINGATYNNNIVTPNVAPETSFFVELELKGLSGLGDDLDSFLQTNLNGYRKAGYFN